MKLRHKAAEAANARAVLKAAGASLGQDFYTLRADQVDQVLQEADRVRYRKPANANGSRGRYFYARLQRLARLTVEG